MNRLLRHIRNLFRLQPGKPALAAGLRAAVAVTVPFLIATLMGSPNAGWTGLTGLLVTLSDRGGSYGSRARAMSATTFLGAIVGAVAAPAGGRLWLDAVLLLVGVCAATFARCYGETAGSTGEKLAVIWVASLGAHAVGLEPAVARGASLVFGGIWAMVQGLVLWPLHPYRPARKAVSEVYTSLADATGDLARLTRAAADPDTWAYDVTLHSTLRLKIDYARSTLAQTRVGRAEESLRGVHLLVLLETSERMLTLLFALAHAMEVASTDPRLAPMRSQVARAADGCEAIFRRVAALARTPDREVDRPEVPSRTEVARELPASVAELVTRTWEDACAAEHTATAMHLRRPAAREGLQILPPPGGGRRPWLEPLRDNLAPDSLVLRHSLRAGLVATATLVVTRALGLGEAYWVVLSAIGILQPYSASTEERALQRAIGTLLGALLAAVIASGVHSALLLLAVVGLLTAISVSLLPLNFGVFQILLTPDFLLLATLGVGDWRVAEMRGIGVLIACAMSLASIRLLWPSPERKRFPDAAAAVLRADGNYLRRVAERPSPTEPEVVHARRDLGLALIDAEASFQRLMAEYRGPAHRLQPAMALLTYSRRLAASVTALRGERAAARTPEVIEDVAHKASGALDALADSLREGQTPPPIPPLPLRRTTDDPVSGELLERVPRQLGVLHGAVARLSTDVALR